MKWGTLYSPAYVNVLYRAASDKITGPFRFICLTDDPAGLDPAIEHHPIPDIGLPRERWTGGWPKFSVFMRDLHGMTGRAIFIDLDMMVLGDLGPMFDFAAPLVLTDMGPTWQRRRRSGPVEPGTCIFAFTAAEQAGILDAFIARRDEIQREYRHEQGAMVGLAPTMAVWPPGWVISFKRHLRRGLLQDLAIPPRRPPPDALVLAFHGEPRPLDLVRAGLWGEFPNLGRGRVPWMADYWRRYGGGDG